MSEAKLTQLGRYRIVAEIGRGAMGVVYRAEDPLLDRTVAIKTILLTGDTAERQSYEVRFLQEARAAGRLSHPAIITIYDVGREGELAYMAMELLRGVDLRERLQQGGLSLREAVALAAEIADGLAFAHEHGVIHRDIKPANIMIVRSGHAKIMDFGLARLPLSDVKTQTGVLLGTPKYMSPEQVAGRPVDHRSDLFALGAVLYEMIVGRPPFSGADTAQLIHRIATAPHAAPSRIVSSVPPLLDLIVARALEKDPSVRYQSAREMAADLHACLAQLPADAGPAAGATPSAVTHPAADPSGPADATLRLAVHGAEPTEALTRADTGSATERLPLPAPSAAAESWPLSPRFDSAAAIQRLRQPSGEDAALLTRVPRPPGGLARIARDPDWRLVAGVMAVSLAVAALITVL
ncbi:serine/threonine-protein kinase [Fontimonas sp. SYSU GA230001]|uniref:serine/threonine-protein kinase n=1 Tax=Fontimonas sp. SYSU GA230001 TaxID=3142450 RepID=UPI0032B501C0